MPVAPSRHHAPTGSVGTSARWDDVRRTSPAAVVRKLLELPAASAGDCSVRVRATSRGRCALCHAWYEVQEWIGYSRDADGWVASCCGEPAGG